MATLVQDIRTQSEWLVKAFASDHMVLNYSIRSFIAIDDFFNRNIKDGKPTRTGRLSTNTGQIMFSIGAYIGETIIKTVPGSVWQTDDNDQQGEITIAVKLANGALIWPVQRVINRVKNGSEDSIYIYGYHVTKDVANESFDDHYWAMEKKNNDLAKKAWWKFWS